MPLLDQGQVIRDTYEVERFLGQGAFAEVYRVKHRFLGRQAMKVFKRAGISLDEIHEMLGEAILLSRIGHPNIVRVFDANVFESPSGNCGYFTMENVPGGSLDKFWRSFGPSLIPVETTVDLIKQVCRGLSQAHQEKPPIIHRDIKPQNILVGYEPDGLRARVSDFGLAKKVNPLTLLATAAGTLQFKPPEAFAQRKADSPAADVWAIGTTLYLLLTDRLPVEMPEGTTWTARNLFDKPITPPTQVNPDISKDLEKVVMRSLEKSPEKRYPSARELLHELDAAPLHDPGPTPRKSLSSEASKTVFGNASPMDGSQARTLVEKALEARRGGRLGEAADLMEEAFNKAPDLREKYVHQVKLWRCGISM
ncbi:MAG TPA: serine/threonine-protein kinase [Verrucomicrobiota bacterium]|nr:serine/threonine-protein kinase [Verrucomicrobiota bacterium]